MSDGDAFTRRAARGWRPLAEALRDGLGGKECAERLEGCISKDLRHNGGLLSSDMRDLLSSGPSTESEADVIRALGELARRKCFERITPLLVGSDRFPTYAKAQEFIQLCLGMARLDVIARSLLRRPGAEQLSRPRRVRQALSDLLDEAAPLGVRA